MDRRILSCLADVANSIDEINEFVGSNRDFLVYRNDLKTKKAVERNLEIIGEAVNRILKADPLFPISRARSIVDLRNRIIHSYDAISDEIIWAIVIRELPELKREVDDVLNQRL
jgi:uncharacterized protein with HEPN domain